MVGRSGVCGVTEKRGHVGLQGNRKWMMWLERARLGWERLARDLFRS